MRKFLKAVAPIVIGWSVGYTISYVSDVTGNVGYLAASLFLIALFAVRAALCHMITLKTLDIILHLDIKNHNEGGTPGLYIDRFIANKPSLYSMIFDLSKWTVEGFFSELFTVEKSLKA